MTYIVPGGALNSHSLTLLATAIDNNGGKSIRIDLHD